MNKYINVEEEFNTIYKLDVPLIGVPKDEDIEEELKLMENGKVFADYMKNELISKSS